MKIIMLLCFLYSCSVCYGSTYVVYLDNDSKKYGYKNEDNKIIIPPIYDKAWSFDPIKLRAKAIFDGVIGYINESGIFTQSKLTPFKDLTNSKWGFVDEDNEVAIAPIFFEASSFIDGIAVVETYYLPERDYLPNLPHRYFRPAEEHYRLMDVKGRYLGKIFRKKPDLNSYKRQKKIGNIFYTGLYTINNGNSVEYEKNLNLAKIWFLKSLKLNPSDLDLMFLISKLSEDDEKIKWMIQAAKKGHHDSIQYLEKNGIWYREESCKIIEEENEIIKEINQKLRSSGIDNLKFFNIKMMRNIDEKIFIFLSEMKDQFVMHRSLIHVAELIAGKGLYDVLEKTKGFKKIQSNLFPILRDYTIVKTKESPSRDFIGVTFFSKVSDSKFSIIYIKNNVSDSKYTYYVYKDDDFPLSAFREMNINLMKWIIETDKIDVNKKNSEGYTIIDYLLTSLFYPEPATFELSKLKYLFDNGFGFFVKDKNNKDTLYYSLQYDNYEAVKFLIDQGACEKNIKNDNYILDYGKKRGRQLRIIKYFYEKCGFDINAKDSNGDTLLHILVRFTKDELLEEDSFNVIDYLLKNGANPNVINLNNENPLQVLLRRKKRYFNDQTLRIVATLLDYGINYELKNKDGLSPSETLLKIKNRIDDLYVDKIYYYLTNYKKKDCTKNYIKNLKGNSYNVINSIPR